MMKSVFVFTFLMLFNLHFVIAEQLQDLNSGVTETAKVEAATAPAALEPAKLAEDQIPLSIEAVKKVSDSNSTATKAMMSMVIIITMLGAGFYFIRRYKTSNSINKSNMQIKVLSQHYLGPKKSLAIVHVAGESILVGVTENNISMIKSLSLIDDEVPANLPNNFGQTMAGIEAVADKKNTQVSQTKAAPQFELDEEFSFSNVTETVSKKIKSMRSFS